MFGQQSSPFASNTGSTPFGQQNNTGFGVPQQNNSTPFGGGGGNSGSGFGFGSPGPTNNTGFGGSSGFGVSNNNSSGFGGFGANNSTGSTGFGATGNSGFGSNNNNAGGGLFGAPAQAPSGGLFGAPAPAPTGIFGSTGNSGFGGNNNNNNVGGGLFGNNQSSAFGSNQNNNAGGGGLFGSNQSSTPFNQQKPGTAAVQYQITSRPDGSNSSISLQAITAMAAYEGKSFEELRLEDYMAGNKGGQQQQQQQSGGFGFNSAPTPAPLFGNAPAPLFGNAPAPSFGAPAPATFGNSTFGNPAPAPSTGFGFGTQNNTANSGFAFGSGAQKPSLFGAPAPAPTTGLFGGNTTSAPAPFSSNTSSFGFGNSNNSNSLFGSNTPAPATGLFGNTPAPTTSLFGSAPAPTSLFGSAPAPGTTSLFGSTTAPTPAPLFGNTPSTGFGGFGSTNSTAPAPLFGNNQSSTLFGNSTSAPAPLFGSTPAPSLFGASTGAAPVNNFNNASAVAPPSQIPNADALLAQKLAAIEEQKKELALLDTWRNTSPSSGITITPNSSQGRSLSVPSTVADSSKLTSTFRPYRFESSPLVNIRPRGLKLKANHALATPTRSTRAQSYPFYSPNTFFASNKKKLIVQPDALLSKPNLKMLVPIEAETNTNHSATPSKVIVEKLPMQSPLIYKNDDHKPIGTPNTPMLTDGSSRLASSSKKNFMKDYAYEFYVDTVHAGHTPKPKLDQISFLPILTKPEYETNPSMQQLSTLSETELATVSNFSIERPGFGSISWDNTVDVRAVNFDISVQIEDREVFVYHKEEANGTKPTRGTKLNKSAVITLCNIYPKAGKNATDSQKAKFAKKVEKQTNDMKSEFISYDSNKGTWKFRVQHFSRYGLLDDDSDDEQVLEDVLEQKQLSMTRLKAPMDEDDEIVDYHVKFTFEDKVETANNAYQDLLTQLKTSNRTEFSLKKEMDIVSKNPDRNEDYNFYSSFPVDIAFELEKGIIQRIKKAFDRTNEKISSVSSQDFGLRMRKSFRTTWHPNCMLFGPSINKNMSYKGQYKSVKPFVPKIYSYIPFLEIHLKHSVRKKQSSEDSCCFFSLPQMQKNVINAIEDYVTTCEEQKQLNISSELSETHDILLHGFQLLLILYCSDGVLRVSSKGNQLALRSNGGSPSYDKRLIAFQSWLQRALSKGLHNDICSLQKSKDIYSSLFVCLACGDRIKASEIALKNDLHYLSSIITANDDHTRAFVSDQLKHWRREGGIPHIPATLYRLYQLISGNVESEEIQYQKKDNNLELSWMRRFGMKFWCYPEKAKDIVSKIDSYEYDVNAGLAPPPVPGFWKNVDKMTNKKDRRGYYSLIYRILLLFSSLNEGDVDASYVISPKGYSKHTHDFSFAFHLSRVMNALNCCPKMNEYNENLVIDGFVFQLENEGLWEWAIYVKLCTTAATVAKEKEISLQVKDIIKRHTMKSDVKEEFVRKRSFLETKIGIPSSWFEEALAMRFEYEGDFKSSSKYLISAGKGADALRVIVKNSLADITTKGGETVESLKLDLEYMQSLGLDEGEWNNVNGCGVNLSLLNLKENVLAFSKLPLDQQIENKATVDKLLDTLGELKTKVIQADLNEDDILSDYAVVNSVACAEASSLLKVLEEILLSLQNGLCVTFHDQSIGNALVDHILFS